MLKSTASGNEADDDDTTILQRLEMLEKQLAAAWDENSSVYNAELTASLTRPEPTRAR